jgi:hypothetical protein
MTHQIAHAHIPSWAYDYTHYDGLEIGPVRFVSDDELEACHPSQADLWSVYGHLPEGGVEALEDFDTHVEAFNFAFACVENNESLHKHGLSFRF